MEKDDKESLERLLRERVATIGDHAWRDRDPEGHMDKLKTVSEAIFAEHARIKVGGQIPPRLEHFLSGCSYEKALVFLGEMGGGSE